MSVCQTCTIFIFLNLFFILNPLVPIWENLNQLWPTPTSLRAKRSVKTSPSLRACPTGRRAKRSNLYSNNRLPACRQTGFSRSLPAAGRLLRNDDRTTVIAGEAIGQNPSVIASAAKQSIKSEQQQIASSRQRRDSQ